MKKKVIKIVVIILFALFILDGIIVAVSAHSKSKDAEWGLTLTATDVSPSGLTLTLERNDSERAEPLITGDSYWIQRRMLFNWINLKPLDGQGAVFDSVGYSIEDGDSKCWNINWSYAFGKLAPGVYRISKNSNIDGTHSYSEETRNGLYLTPTVYATFVVLF